MIPTRWTYAYQLAHAKSNEYKIKKKKKSKIFTNKAQKTKGHIIFSRRQGITASTAVSTRSNESDSDLESSLER